MSEEKDKNINVAIWCVVIVVLLLAASFIIWIFTNRTESHVVSEIDDAETEALSGEIANKIQTEMTYPGQVKITVIRETRSVAYAK